MQQLDNKNNKKNNNNLFIDNISTFVEFQQYE